MEAEKFYMISEAVKKTGVARYTLLWWEDKGMLQPERRTNPHSHMADRYYSEDDIVRIKILKVLGTQKGKDFCIDALVNTIKGNEALAKGLEDLFEEAKKVI